jgi:hypothetical protein
MKSHSCILLEANIHDDWDRHSHFLRHSNICKYRIRTLFL